jgi:SAM-dependent methyltransferase
MLSHTVGSTDATERMHRVASNSSDVRGDVDSLDIACRLCGSRDLRLYYTQGNGDEFRFYRCSCCGLVNYDLSGGLDQEKYSRSFDDPLDDTLRSNRAQTITYQFLASQIPGRGCLLDIGCGNGRLLHLARKAGWTVAGLEVSAFLAESVTRRLGIPVTVGDIGEYEMTSHARHDKYDCIVLRHVLEHLPDPISSMASIRSLLAAGGYVLLEFPNIEGLDIKFKRWLRKMHLAHKWYPPSYKPGHCNEYCRASFQQLIDRTGFTLVTWQTYSHHPIRDRLFNQWHIGGKVRTIIRKT